MKMNKWTLGLAAVGLVSLTPGLRAADAAPAPVPVMTALSATTISGYVDTSAVWNPGTGNANPAPYSFNAGKQDGFNLDAVDIKIAKPLDEGQWSAGYTVELMYGPDATTALGAWAPIRQAYVDLRVPVGNGIDLKLGEWDNVLGFESTDSMNNLNWTRSYGYTIEPTEHVGLLAEYIFNPSVDLKVGVADELSAGFNRNVSGNSITANPAVSGGGTTTTTGTIECKKALVSLLTLTAPDSWGSLKGSALYAGLDYGPGNAYETVTTVPNAKPPPATVVVSTGSHVVDKLHLYVGTVLVTPVTGLKFGAAWDTVNNSDLGLGEGYASSLAGYVSYKATDKMTINGRAEYAHGSAFDNLVATGNAQEAKILAFTGTLQYDLWANVISRLEVRWDTSADGSPMFGGTATGVPAAHNELMVAANVIYKF
jgi:hypothetical protein